MRIVNVKLGEIRKQKNPVVACIGYFDGMHKGHQALVNATLEKAKELGVESGLITFDPDPWVTLRNEKDVKHITPLQQRINIAVELGIKNIFILNFTKEMAALSPLDFIKVLDSCNIKALICGFDYHYGQFGKGDIESLKRDADFEVVVVDAVNDNEGKISSTRITNLIEEGEVHKAEELLGYAYRVEGYVVHGNAKGRTIGYPTANVSVPSEYLEPKGGVYACFALIDGKKYKAMVNIGHNPTFNYTETMSLEAYILDFSGDLYDKRLKISFKYYLRPEKKFKYIGNLKMQLEQDEFAVRTLLREG
ncbi:MAG: riboflavin biosynthesis protein RibF [Bulleidia sp.]|nr:riboflavin biosynthesis protein RibF [Erysipelotrichaceae bacterium]MDY2780247.1 riboflavin biosynthesis protein RibF [Bulleidia sp.]